MELSLPETTVILNGHTVEGGAVLGTRTHTVQGWSEDTDALTLPDAFEFATVRRGAAGDMAAFPTGDRGGPVTLKLLPNSLSVPFFMQQVTRILVDKAVVIWDGSAHNLKTGYRATFRRGVLMSGPLGYTMGKGEVGNLTFTWEFEEIIPDFGSVSFADVPTVSAANGG